MFSRTGIFLLILCFPLSGVAQQATWTQGEGFFGGYAPKELVSSNGTCYALWYPGLFWSDDLAVSWHRLRTRTPFDLDYARSHISAIRDRIYVADSAGVFWSSDKGRTWTNVAGPIPAPVSVLCTQAGRLYAIAGSYLLISDSSLGRWVEMDTLPRITAVAADSNYIYVFVDSVGLLRKPHTNRAWQHYGVADDSTFSRWMQPIVGLSGALLWEIGSSGIYSRNPGEAGSQWVYHTSQPVNFVPVKFGMRWYLPGRSWDGRLLSQQPNWQSEAGWPSGGLVGLVAIDSVFLRWTDEDILYRSTDTGHSWTYGGKGHIGELTRDIGILGNRLVVRLGLDILSSTDNGLNWNFYWVPADVMTRDFVYYVSSAKQGDTLDYSNLNCWSFENRQFRESSWPRRLLIKSLVAEDSTLIVLGDNFEGFYFSSDGGQQWSYRSQLHSGHDLLPGVFTLQLHDGVLYLKSSQTWHVSADWGATWEDVDWPPFERLRFRGDTTFGVGPDLWIEKDNQFSLLASANILGKIADAVLAGNHIFVSSETGVWYSEVSRIEWKQLGELTPTASGELAISGNRLLVCFDGVYSTPLDRLRVSREQNPPSISLYPNPCASLLHVITSNPSTSIVLQDVLGRVVRRIESGSLSRTVDVSDLPAGAYNIHLLGKAERSTTRLVIAH